MSIFVVYLMRKIQNELNVIKTNNSPPNYGLNSLTAVLKDSLGIK